MRTVETRMFGAKQRCPSFLSFPSDDDDTASHSGVQYPERFENLAIAVDLGDICYGVRVEAISNTTVSCKLSGGT